MTLLYAVVQLPRHCWHIARVAARATGATATTTVTATTQPWQHLWCTAGRRSVHGGVSARCNGGDSHGDVKYEEVEQRKDIKSPQFYESHAARREYFYWIDSQGRLFLEDTVPKMVATSLKSAKFLDFFWRNLKPNKAIKPGSEGERLHPDYPWLSPCGKEMNFVKAADVPIVFHTLTHDGKLIYAATRNVEFDPACIVMSTEGRLYHSLLVPRISREPILGLLHSHVAQELVAHMVDDGHGGFLMRWKSQEHPVKLTERGDSPLLLAAAPEQDHDEPIK